MNNNLVGNFKIPKKKNPESSEGPAATSTPNRIRVNYTKNENNETEGQAERITRRKRTTEKREDDSPAVKQPAAKKLRLGKELNTDITKNEHHQSNGKQLSSNTTGQTNRRGRQTKDSSESQCAQPVPDSSGNKNRGRGSKRYSQETEGPHETRNEDSRVKSPELAENADATTDNGKKKRARKSNSLETPEIENDRSRENGETKKRGRGGKQTVSKEKENLACGACDQSFETSTAFRNHRLSAHSGLARPRGESQEFTDSEKMKAFKEAIAVLKKLSCSKCEKKFASAAGFAYHVKWCGKSEEEQSNRLQECPVCQAKVVVLKSHMKTHTRSEDDDKETRNEETRNGEGLSSKKRASAIKAGGLISKVAASIEDEDGKKHLARVRWHFVPPGTTKVTNSIIGAWKRQLSTNQSARCRYPGCSFASGNLEQLKEHHVQCEIGCASKYFSCLKCSFQSQSKAPMIDHVTQSHLNDRDFRGEDDDEEEEDDESEGEEEEFDKSLRKAERKGTLNRSLLDLSTPSLIFRKPEVLNKFPQLLAAFHRENYTWDRPLFADWLPAENKRTPLADKDKYIPSVKKTGKFAVICDAQMKDWRNLHKGPTEWKQMEIFQSQNYEDSAMFFCGDSVMAAAWCPVPNIMGNLVTTEKDQFLAISTFSKIQKNFSALENAPDRLSSIQIWNCGKLESSTEREVPPEVSMIIGLAFGRVWDLEWCPSGAYNENLDRLGLLAAACGDGTVRILTIPFPRRDRGNELEITEAQVSATLRLQNSQASECTSLNWDTTENHRFVVAGFADGSVAVWDIGTTSKLLRKNHQNSNYFWPVWTFKGHQSVVTGVSLSPQHRDARFVATVSGDRTLKLWDRHDPMLPVTVLERSKMTRIKWKKHWPCVAVTQDDCYALLRTTTFLYDFGCSGQKQGILTQNSFVSDLTENEYTDLLVHCTAAGEIQSAKSFVPFIDSDDLPKIRQMMMRTDLVNLDDESGPIVSRMKQEYLTNRVAETSASVNANRTLFTDAQQKPVIDNYGIIIHLFSDHKKTGSVNRKKKTETVTSEKMDVVRPCDKPVASINRVAFNPNLQSHSWICVCGENGLVQLLNISNVSRDDIKQNYWREYSKN